MAVKNFVTSQNYATFVAPFYKKRIDIGKNIFNIKTY